MSRDENRSSAHPIQGFDNDLFLLCQEAPELVEFSGNQAGGATIGKPRNVCFLIDVAETRRLIDHQQATLLRQLKDIGRVDVLHVKRRILAHEQYIQLLQAAAPLRARFIPTAGVVINLDLQATSERSSIPNGQVVLAKVNERPSPVLGSEEHRQGGVLSRVDALDWVHDHA